MPDGQNEESTERSIYELGFHIVPTVGDDNLGAEVAAIKSMIERSGGIFIAEEFPTLTALHYPVGRKTGKKETYTTPYFGWVKFELEPRHIKDLEEHVDSYEHVLRYLLIKTVREDTRIPKRVFQKQQESAPIKSKTTPEKSAPVSEEELDRSIAELVVE